jgi:hypothetical protein
MGTGAAAGAGQLPEDPVSPVSSATSQQMSSEAAAAPAGSSGSSSADDIDPDEAQRLQHLLATQQHLQQQQQQQQGQQLEGQQQAGAGQQLEERVEGSLFRAVLVLSGMLLILLARRTLRGVLQAMFVPLCIVLPSLLTGRTLLLVASWLLGTPANGIARSIASAPPTAAAAAAASVSHQQQAAPWLPITAPVVLLNWTLSSWERVQEYIRPHWMLPLSLADVTALTLGGAALCTLPWAFFVSFAIMTKHWGLEPGADTQQVSIPIIGPEWIGSAILWQVSDWERSLSQGLCLQRPGRRPRQTESTQGRLCDATSLVCVPKQLRACTAASGCCCLLLLWRYTP